MLAADALLEAAVARTGLQEFGPADGWREGLDRFVDAANAEAELTQLGVVILGQRLGMLLANRLRVVDAGARHPEIATEKIDGPLCIIGLPRTGTTALSNLLAVDPQIRSVRLWESSDPVPPPETATQETDPRIETTRLGLDAMYATFPRMRTLYFQTATGPTECQDLLGMSFRTADFDGMALVPSYTDWVVDCDMAGAYAFHRRTLQLLQWRCPPRLWHLKTPVHMLALDALLAVYPEARFLWTHRDPADALGSVCSLVSYTRSWVGAAGDPVELGRRQAHLWAEALRRAMATRARLGEGRFADVAFARLQTEPVAALSDAYATIGLDLGAGRGPVQAWADAHPPRGEDAHQHPLADYGLGAAAVRERFAPYLERFAPYLERSAPHLERSAPHL